MDARSERTRLLIGEEGQKKLAESRVLVFGAGGVGSYVLEALTRTGIGTIGVCDFDTVSESNINRQLYALESTVGRRKVDVCAERAKDIDPDIRVLCFAEKVTPENLDIFDFTSWDYVVDAIDDVKAKVAIAETCTKRNVPFIMSMGTGNKLDPSKLRVTDLSKTHTCPLAKAVRKELGKKDIRHAKVVFSEELPVDIPEGPVGTVIFVPASAGLLIASEVVRDLLGR